MESVITIVRSLVISKKPPCLVTDILRDYREIEGESLPFQKFGYRNAEEFLSSSNAFVLDRYGGNTYVTAKATAESAHIQSMVRLQKSAKTKKSKPASRFPGKTNQNWNKTSYSSVYGQNNSNNYRANTSYKPANSYNKPLRPAGGDRNNNSNSYYQNLPKKPLHQLRPQPQPQSQPIHQLRPQPQPQSQQRPAEQTMVRSSSSGSENWRNPENNYSSNYSNGKSAGTMSMPEDMRNRLAGNKKRDVEPQVRPADDLRNKLNAMNSSNVPKPQPPVAKQQTVTKPVETTNQIRQTNQQPQQQQPKLSISNRLHLNRNDVNRSDPPAVNRSLSNETNLTVIKDSNLYQNNQPKPKPQKEEKPFKFIKEHSPLVQLQDYCNSRHINPPQYDTRSWQKKFKCVLNVNGRTYFSDEFDSEADAKNACTLEALEEIKKKEAIPICTDPNYMLKIHEKLLQNSAGVFANQFVQWFELAFEQRIPTNWYEDLQRHSNLFSVENSFILAKKTSPSTPSSSASSEMEYFVSTRIELPFEEKYWNLYITHCKSTVEVWGRLLKAGYSDKYENLMNDIEMHMLSNARRPQSISVGQIYLVKISDCWHRIRVEERRTNEFLCFYIDFGDEEWVDVEKIYLCEPRFLNLPPQGIVFSLFGLEDFSGNRCAERILNNVLPNQSLVGEVLTKKEVYEQSFDDSTTCGEYKIQVVLYDTSSNEDINLNESLGKQICDETPPPVLKGDGLTTNVNVTHVAENGNLFVQIRNSDSSYVEKLINDLVESKQINQHKIKKYEMSLAGMYLVRSARNGPFLRAILINPPDGDKDIYDMFYVDFGSTDKIHISDIYRLDSLSAALSKYPSQAIEVKLAAINEITTGILEKIKKLLPKSTSAIVKVVKNARIQEVIIYTRMTNGTMFNVNDSILIEIDLERQLENGTDSNPKPARNPLKTSSPNPVNVVSVEQKLPDLQDYKLPTVNEYMDVLVTMCSNPLNFTVLPYEDNLELDKLMREMKEHYDSTDEYIPSDVIKEGEAYACKHNKYYQRCVVTKVLPNPHVCVKLCDLGEVAVLSNDQLKTLPAKFRTLPKQAINAKLFGIKPINHDWTLKDCMDFKKSIVNKPYVSKILRISTDPIDKEPTLELHLIDTTTENDIYVHQLLIDEGKAILSEDC